MSTFAGSDHCTDIILDMIAEHESAGNYNAVIGDADASDRLAAYSLIEIYHLMDRCIAAGQPSTAIGRYQIIRPTLHNLQRAFSLPSTAKFTDDLQDRMGLHLMQGRGYDAWLRGALGDVDFAHGLACEWASLPDPRNGGKSHYDGVGPNHAGTTLAYVYDALTRARAVKRTA